MVSMKDISIICGVSVATVSKALSGQSDISKETKEYVRKVANELGYHPNSAARALKTNRTYNIGVLFVDKTNSGLNHDYFSSVLDNLKVSAEAKGYDITFINKNIGNSKMSYYEHCKYRGCDGIIIACVDFKDPAITELVDSEIPIVTIDHSFNGITSIISDNVQGMRDLLTYVYNQGHRKIALIHGEDTIVTQNRLASFHRTAQKFGLDIPDEYLRQAAYHDPKSVAIATREILSLKNPPTCIMFPDDFSSIGGLNVIEEFGLSIPDDISVTGYDGIYLSQVLRPKLTTLKQDTLLLGQLAAEQLIESIENPKTSIIQQINVPGQLLTGRSVRNISQINL